MSRGVASGPVILFRPPEARGATQDWLLPVEALDPSLEEPSQSEEEEKMDVDEGSAENKENENPKPHILISGMDSPIRKEWRAIVESCELSTIILTSNSRKVVIMVLCKSIPIAR